MQSHDYAEWDDAPYQQPPRPPLRPTAREWAWLKERHREAYDAGVQAYLMATSTPQQYQTYCDMAIFYRTCFAEAGLNDPTWKRAH